MKKTVLSSATLMLMFAVCVPVLAQDKPQDKDKPDFPKFEEVTKDMKTVEGFITIYRDDKKDKLFARIPAKTLDKPFLLATSIARGPEYAGWQWVDAAVYWERIDKKLVLMGADPRYTKGKGSTVEDVIARTYTDSIIQTVTIVTEIEGDPVIDLGKLLKTDFAQIREAFPGKIDASLSRIATVKNFEKNLEVDVDLAVNSPGGNGGSEVGIHYSFHYLPDNGFKSREADPRVGYFLTVMKDWTANHNDRTIFKRYINRWELRKAQPDQEVSDVRPEDQIVFYIEKTVPVKYRRYVREGIEEWNKAFEAAGLRNAVAAIQQTDTVHNDKDPEDVRYNFIRWIVTGTPFAMGPSRVNPFTGQILDADIIFDDSMIRSVLHEYDISGPKAIDSNIDSTVSQFLAEHPEWNDACGHNHLSLGHTSAEYEDDSIPGTPTGLKQKPSWLPQGQFEPTEHRCDVGIGMVRELAMATFQAAQAGRDLPEEYIGQAIKETIMHEVGHTLGLRHNFKASSWQKLKDGHVAGDFTKPTTASVMDYNPYTFADNKAEQGSFATPTLGPYDIWAIEYGYKEFVKKDGEGQPKDEKEMLRKIASRCTEPGLDYATDEDTSDVYPDPRVNRWDDGREPMEFATDRINAVDKLWKDGLDWSVKDGASLNKARRVFNTLLNQYGFAARIAARNVGGQYVYRDHKGDPNERPARVPVPPAEQRAALKFLADTVFSDKSFQFSTTLLNALAPGRWSHWDSDAMDSELTLDVHDRVLTVRMRVLFLLMNPFTINRIYDTQIHNGEDVLTVPELFRTVSGTVWSELSADGKGDGKFTNRKPFISSYRRALQRGHAQRLIAISLSQPGATLYADPHAVSRMALKDLGASIQKTLKDRGDRLDDASRAHLEDTNRRIKEALEAEYELR